MSNRGAVLIATVGLTMTLSAPLAQADTVTTTVTPTCASVPTTSDNSITSTDTAACPTTTTAVPTTTNSVDSTTVTTTPAVTAAPATVTTTVPTTTLATTTVPITTVPTTTIPTTTLATTTDPATSIPATTDPTTTVPTTTVPTTTLATTTDPTTTTSVPTTTSTTTGAGALTITTGPLQYSSLAAPGQGLDGTMTVTVTDTRPSSAGWSAKVSMPQFVGERSGSVIYPDHAAYSAHSTVCSDSTGPQQLSSDHAVVEVGRAGCTATWDADVSVGVPRSGVVADTYSTVITHSVA